MTHFANSSGKNCGAFTLLPTGKAERPGGIKKLVFGQVGLSSEPLLFPQALPGSRLSRPSFPPSFLICCLYGREGTTGKFFSLHHSPTDGIPWERWRSCLSQVFRSVNLFDGNRAVGPERETRGCTPESNAEKQCCAVVSYRRLAPSLSLSLARLAGDHPSLYKLLRDAHTRLRNTD